MGFDTIIDYTRRIANKKATVVVAAAGEQGIISATVQAKQEGIADFIYVGDSELIKQLASEHRIDISGIGIIHEADILKAGKMAVKLVNSNVGQALMKGRISTRKILKMVMTNGRLKEKRGNQFLSHVSLFEWEGRLKIFSDPALTILPTFEQKIKITQNAINIARRLGFDEPIKVAFISAIEKVNKKMQSSVDAEKLAELDWGSDIIAGGPIAFDGAISERAYKIKNVPSPVGGKADIFIFPYIEVPNLLWKVLTWMMGLDMAGVVAGAGIPFIVASRSDSQRVKFLSIATAIYLIE